MIPTTHAHPLPRDGTSRAGRVLPALEPDRRLLDDRPLPVLLGQLRRLARGLKFINLAGLEEGTWEPFFTKHPADAALRALPGDGTFDASLPAHLGLALAFLHQFRHAQDALNDLVRRHLEFYFRGVLGLAPRPPVADRVYALFEAARGVGSARLAAGTELFAGKDALKRGLHFALERELVVNRAVVAEQRSLFVDRAAHARLLAAPVAAAADGQGAALPADNPSYAPFGHAGLAFARRGFALAAPLLRLTGGRKRLQLELRLTAAAAAVLVERCTAAAAHGGPALSAAGWPLAALFTVRLTGAEGWIEPSAAGLSAVFDPGTRRLRLALAELPADTALVPHDPELHGRMFATEWPVCEVTLNEPSAAHPGGFLDALALEAVTLRAFVEDDVRLVVANDLGAVDPAKAFQAFGPAPTVQTAASAGSSLYVGSPEIFAKRLEAFSVNLEWKDLPAGSLHDYFAGYATYQFDRVDIRRTGASAAVSVSTPESELRAVAAPQDRRIETGSPFRAAAAVLRDGLWAADGAETADLFAGPLAVAPAALAALGADPALAPFATPELGQPRGFVRFMLTAPDHAFGHADYPRLYTNAVVRAVKSADANAVPQPPNPPFAPLLARISADYTAVATRAFGAASAEADAPEFFHVGPFGEWRADDAEAATPAPVPPLDFDGAWLLGLEGLEPGSSVALLLHLADGSGNPFAAYPVPRWEYLAGDAWKPFAAVDLVADTTNTLRRTGVIQFAVPADATLDHTRLPAGRIWLRAVAAGDVSALNHAYAVHAQAAEAVFTPDGNDLTRLAAPLPAGSVARLVAGRPEIRKVTQPLPSFGGAPLEAAPAFRQRVSERLRHRDRARSLWDYERLILEAFPALHRVKCIPHATPDSELAPGHVLVVVVPRVTPGAYHPLQPAAPQDTLAEVKDFLGARMSGLARVAVVNPAYEEVQAAAAVVLRPGFDAGFYAGQIVADVQGFLAPWLTDADSPASFNATVQPSQILNFLEEREYVDFVRDFAVRHLVGGAPLTPDPAVLRPTREAAILVPAAVQALTVTAP